jgi:hypothetical protein
MGNQEFSSLSPTFLIHDGSFVSQLQAYEFLVRLTVVYDAIITNES